MPLIYHVQMSDSIAAVCPDPVQAAQSHYHRSARHPRCNFTPPLSPAATVSSWHLHTRQHMKLPESLSRCRALATHRYHKAATSCHTSTINTSYRRPPLSSHALHKLSALPVSAPPCFCQHFLPCHETHSQQPVVPTTPAAVRLLLLVQVFLHS